MEAFNLKRALGGDKVVTRSGLNIISLEIDVSKKDDFDVKAMDDRNIVKFYNRKGFWKIGQLSAYDLYMKEIESKPIYTQVMCDAGEMPSVGMECMIFYNESNSRFNDFFDCKIKILAITGDVFTFESPLYGLGALKINIKMIKPLTPPIELIDGKAYQFDYVNNKKTYCGIYNFNSNRFLFSDGHVMASYCINIKLLGVVNHD